MRNTLQGSVPHLYSPDGKGDCLRQIPFPSSVSVSFRFVQRKEGTANLLCLLSFVQIEKKLKQRTEKGSAAGNPPCRQANINAEHFLAKCSALPFFFCVLEIRFPRRDRHRSPHRRSGAARWRSAFPAERRPQRERTPPCRRPSARSS